MTYTTEDLAAGLQYDSQIEAAETLRRKKVHTAIKASFLVSTALFAAFVFKSKTKPPTLH